MCSAKELTIETWMATFRNGSRVTGCAPDASQPTAQRPATRIERAMQPHHETELIDAAELAEAF